MSTPPTVLLLDGFDVSQKLLARRMAALHFSTLRATTPEEIPARLAVQRVDAVVLPSDLPPREAASLVTELRTRTRTPLPGLLAAGPEPRGEVRDALREAGIPWALWDPFDDAFLRYQLNRALAPREGRAARRALRVPCSIPTRARCEAGERPGRLYTLSERGLFFETPGAAAAGTPVALELRIAGRAVPAEGHVTLANLPGARRNPKLPVGIGVQFTRVTPPGLRAIRHTVAALASILDI